MKKYYIIFSIIVLFISLAFINDARADFDTTPRDNFYVTNGSVKSTALSADGETLYIGGDFTYVGPKTGGGAIVDTTSALKDNSPIVSGVVYASVQDNNDGWYIGGDFTKVGSYNRANLAHILYDGTVDANWNPGTNDKVFSLEINDTTLFVGGAFTSIGGQNRNHIAAIDISSGVVTGWNPDANGNVNILKFSNNYNAIYAGGEFSVIGRETRNFLASLDAGTGEASPSFVPEPNGYINTMTLNDGDELVYVSGEFDNIGGEDHSGLAAVWMDTGSLFTDWAPVFNTNPTYLLYDPLVGLVYAAGEFTIGGGQSRNYVAALDSTTGAATAWNPNITATAGNKVTSLYVYNSAVYFGGVFSSVGGQARNNIAAVDQTTGVPIEWNPFVSGGNSPKTISVNDIYVYIGGDFSSVGGSARNYIAALDTSSGVLTSWNPNASGSVEKIVVDGSTIYAGGAFTTIGGQTRRRIAALDSSSGLSSSWNPDLGSLVYDIAVSGSVVYAGGAFDTVAGSGLNGKRIVALDKTTGLISSNWNCSASGGSVHSLLVDGSTLYVGGNFTSISSGSRNGIAALNATTGALLDWNPNANLTVDDMYLSDSTLYVGGSFTSIGGQSRNRIAALSTTTGLATSWNPNANSSVSIMRIIDSLLYVAGSFTSIGGQLRSGFAVLDLSTGLAGAWDPNFNGSVYSFISDNSNLYAGGTFSTVGSIAENRLAVLPKIITIPDAPSDLSIETISNNYITIAWDDNSNNEANFIIEKSVNGEDYEEFTQLGENIIQVDVNSLSPNTRYWFRVAATNEAGTSDYVYSSGVYTLAQQPNAVTAVANGTTSITVSWSGGVTSGYYVSYNNGNSGWLNSNIASYRFSDLSCGTSYEFSLISKNGDDTTTSPSVVTALTNNCPVSNSRPLADIIKTNICTNVTYTDWQGVCINGYEYRSYLSTSPSNCSLTQEQINNAKRACSIIIPNNPITPSTPNIPTTPSKPIINKFIFKKNLKLGDNNSDVKQLQIYLNNNGFIVSKTGAGSKGKETNYFGPATKNALVRFQKAKKIKPPSGYFGPLTRAVVNK